MAIHFVHCHILWIVGWRLCIIFCFLCLYIMRNNRDINFRSNLISFIDDLTRGLWLLSSTRKAGWPFGHPLGFPLEISARFFCHIVWTSGWCPGLFQMRVPLAGAFSLLAVLLLVLAKWTLCEQELGKQLASENKQEVDHFKMMWPIKLVHERSFL